MKQILYFTLFIWIGLISIVGTQAQSEAYDLISLVNHFIKGDQEPRSKASQEYINRFAQHNNPIIIKEMIADVKQSGYNGEGRSNLYSFVVMAMYNENDQKRQQVLNMLHSIIKMASKEDSSIASDFLADIEEMMRNETGHPRNGE